MIDVVEERRSSIGMEVENIPIWIYSEQTWIKPCISEMPEFLPEVIQEPIWVDFTGDGGCVIFGSREHREYFVEVVSFGVRDTVRSVVIFVNVSAEICVCFGVTESFVDGHLHR